MQRYWQQKWTAMCSARFYDQAKSSIVARSRLNFFDVGSSRKLRDTPPLFVRKFLKLLGKKTTTEIHNVLRFSGNFRKLKNMKKGVFLNTIIQHPSKTIKTVRVKGQKLMITKFVPKICAKTSVHTEVLQ